jgi:hypothetical protein
MAAQQRLIAMQTPGCGLDDGLERAGDTSTGVGHEALSRLFRSQSGHALRELQSQWKLPLQQFNMTYAFG